MATPRRPDHIPSVGWAMTPFPWLVDVQEPLSRARELMQEQDIRHLPVTRDDQLIGIVSARDIELAVSISPEAAPAESLTVGHVSALDPYVVDISEPLDSVLSSMAKRRLGAALVTRHGKLAGIFTASDACRTFSEFLRAMFPEGPDDEVA